MKGGPHPHRRRLPFVCHSFAVRLALADEPPCTATLGPAGGPPSSLWLRPEQLAGPLQAHALENQRRNLSRTFVLVDDAGAVIGYYSLAMGGVVKDDLPRRLGRGFAPLPDWDGPPRPAGRGCPLPG